MPALDTIGFLRTTGGGGSDSAYNAVTMASGDSATIRSFAPTDFCELWALNATAGAAPLGVRMRSPLMHDVSEGVQVIPGNAAGAVYLPRQFRQRLKPQDATTIEIKGSGTSDDNVGFALLYYSNLPGAAARLHSKADFATLVKNVKVIQVTSGSLNAAGTWTDTLITNTENLLHANTDYAVLGFITDSAVTAIAVKGIDTGNLRCGCPGLLDGNITSQWFVKLNEDTGLPCIPVINAANSGGLYVSVLFDEATGTPNVQVVVAELAQNIN